MLVWCLLALMLMHAERVEAQEARDLAVGAIQFTTNEAITSDAVRWPQDQPAREESDGFVRMLDANSIIIGVRRTWTDPGGVTRDIHVAQIGLRKFSDIDIVTPPVSGDFARTFRNPFPRKVIDGTDWTPVQAVGDPVQSAAPADAMVYNHLNTWTGIDIERWAYAFASDEHDDYVIMEYKFTNTTGETMNDVYFGLQAQTHASTYYGADLWGTYYGATYANFAGGDPSAEDMRLWYAWDADQTGAQPTVDTRGKPDSQWGHFREPQMFGHLVLHADASATDESDDPAKPIKAGWSQRELAPDLNVAGHEDIYAYLSEGWSTANPGAYAVTIDANGIIVPAGNGPYRILDPAIDINNTTQFDPLTEQEKTSLFSFGPYTMAPGEDVRVVTALVGGQIPYRWAIDAGRAYANGNAQQFALVPLPYNIVNPFTSATVATAGTTLDKATKNAVLDISRDFLFDNARKAIANWEGGNVNGGTGSFSVPLAPASPSLTATSENDQVRLEWGSEAEMDASAGPIALYRIYREYTRPAALELPTDTTFLVLDEVPGGTLVYVDTDVIRGGDYYYYVTAVNNDGIESSRYSNRTGTAADKVLEAVSPTRSPDANWKDNVVVVPNPFHIQGAFNYEEERRLNFLNLPAYANIHIYSMTGDRIQTIRHDASTGDQDWERQDSFSTLEIVSGIYIFVVEELDGPRGSATGEQAIGKFVVIK